jgi:hypothetical protein
LLTLLPDHQSSNQAYFASCVYLYSISRCCILFLETQLSASCWRKFLLDTWQLMTVYNVKFTILREVCQKIMVISHAFRKWIYRCPKNGVLTVHYFVEEITVNVRKMWKKFDWTYLLIWRSLKLALNRSIISKYIYVLNCHDSYL